jgi:hypothetical protein
MEHIGTLAAASLSMISNSNVWPLAKDSVAITHEDHLPAKYVREVDRDLGDLVRFWEGAGVGSGTPVLRRPFNDAERSALERRIWELRCALTAFESRDREALGRAINGMLGAFPMMQRFDQVAALSMARAYLSLAEGRPYWAIVKACQMVRLGTAGLNSGFCPSEPEFNTLVGRLVEPYVNALRRAESLLAATIEPPAPPRPTRAELEARLGRRLGPPSSEPKPPTMSAGDGGHAERVMADLAARKAMREAKTERV